MVIQLSKPKKEVRLVKGERRQFIIVRRKDKGTILSRVQVKGNKNALRDAVVQAQKKARELPKVEKFAQVAQIKYVSRPRNFSTRFESSQVRALVDVFFKGKFVKTVWGSSSATGSSRPFRKGIRSSVLIEEATNNAILQVQAGKGGNFKELYDRGEIAPEFTGEVKRVEFIGYVPIQQASRFG